MSARGPAVAAEGRRLLEAWAQAPLEPWPPILDKQAQLSALSGALGRVARRRKQETQRARVVGALALAASMAGLAYGGWALSGGGAPIQATAPNHQTQPESSRPAPRRAVAHSGARLGSGSGASTEINGVASPLTPGSQVPEGARLALGSEAVRLHFGSGSTARFDAQTRVQLLKARGGQEALYLTRGGTEVEVPPDGRPVEFSVATAAARVVVHGTKFSVHVEAESGRTRVAVTRGRVSVHPQNGEALNLVAGQSWRSPSINPRPSAADAKPESKPKAKPARHGRAPSSKRTVRKPGARRTRPSPSPKSRPRLGAENDLFSRAMALKGQGDDQHSLELLQSFEERYPQSVLSQEVQVERFRVLVRLGRRDEAVRVANDYLRQWPRGFAHEEARKLLLGEP